MTNTQTMNRGQEVRDSEYAGVRLYVGAAPYGTAYIVPVETFAETCIWFDEQESRGWNAW